VEKELRISHSFFNFPRYLAQYLADDRACKKACGFFDSLSLLIKEK